MTFLLALAEKGLGNIEKAQELVNKVIELNTSHSGARFLTQEHTLNSI